MTRAQTICSKIQKVSYLSDYASVYVKGGEMESLKKLLTRTSTGKEPYTLELYRNTGPNGMLDVPKGLVNKHTFPEYFDFAPIGRSVSHRILPFSNEFKGELRLDQKHLANNYLGGLDSYPNGGIIHAPTGAGKTVLGLYLADRLNMPTLIVVPTDRIMTQWIEAVNKFLETECGVIRQDQLVIKDYTVAMVHTLARRLTTMGMATALSYFKHVIYDEVHVMGAETFSRSLTLGTPRVRTGLSATPRRKDGMDDVFLYHIGPILASLSTPTSKPKVIGCLYTGSDAAHDGCIWHGELNLGRYLNRLAQCPKRNELIARYIKQALSKNHSVLVLMDRLIMVDNIRNQLMKLGVPRDLIGVCTGDIKILNKPIILATYGSAGMGLDIPELSCVFLATPRTDVEQAVGRILRLKEGKQFPVVFDVIDQASTIMQKWWYKRLRFYKKYCTDVKLLRGDNGQVEQHES